MENNKKIESLQALRALAFLSIFLVHANGPFIMGYFAVTVFFVLSGFLLMYRHGEEERPVSVTDNLRFAAKKISGIYTCCTLIPYIRATVHCLTNSGPGPSRS